MVHDGLFICLLVEIVLAVLGEQYEDRQMMHFCSSCILRSRNRFIYCKTRRKCARGNQDLEKDEQPMNNILYAVEKCM